MEFSVNKAMQIRSALEDLANLDIPLKTSARIFRRIDKFDKALSEWDQAQKKTRK